MPVLFSEAAAAFEELTLSGGLDTLKVQVPDAWPNLFRQARFLSAVDFVQADRLRRRVATEMARVFSEVDLLLVPSLRDEMLTISNFTGHPSLTLRAGFVNVSEARSDWAPDPNEPVAEVLAAAPRAARRHAARPAVRRRHRRACRTCAGAGVQCRRRAPRRILSRRATSVQFRVWLRNGREARLPAIPHCDRDRQSWCITAVFLQADGRSQKPGTAAGRRRSSTCRR